jgi:hypothetical protein
MVLLQDLPENRRRQFGLRGAPSAFEFNEYVLDQAQKVVPFQVPELTGVEETSAAFLTGLIPNMRLLSVNHPQHGRAAFGTIKARLGVLGCFIGMSRINRFRSFHGREVSEFKLIKPEAATLGAAVDLYLLDLNRLHF